MTRRRGEEQIFKSGETYSRTTVENEEKGIISQTPWEKEDTLIPMRPEPAGWVYVDEKRYPFYLGPQVDILLTQIQDLTRELAAARQAPQ